MSWAFTNGPGDRVYISGRVIPKTQKMVLDVALFTTQHYKVRINGKVEQAENWVAPSSMPWCCSYRKVSLRATLNLYRPLNLYGLKYLFLFIIFSLTVILSQLSFNNKTH